MASAEQLQTIRTYAQSLVGNERQSFIDNFNSIKTDDSKISTLSDRISLIQPSNQQNPPSQQDNLYNFSNADREINSRTPYYQGLTDVMGITKKPEYVKESQTAGQAPILRHPFQTALDLATVVPRKVIGVPLQAIGAGFNLVTGLGSDVALDLQRGRPQDIPSHLGQTIIGKRQPNVADVYKGAGVSPGISNAAGLATEIAFTPGGAKLTSDLMKGIIKSPGKIYNFGKDIIQTPRLATQEAQERIFKIGQQTDISQKSINDIRDIKILKIQQTKDAILKGYNELDATLQNSIAKEGTKEARKLPHELGRLFNKKTFQYGKDLDSLIKGKNITIPAKKIIGDVENLLIQKGILRLEGETGKLVYNRLPVTSGEKQIDNLYRRALAQDDLLLNAEEILSSGKSVQPKFGKSWTSDDKLRAEFSQKFANTAEEYIPGYKKLKKDYAPYLKWKKQIIRETQPFSGPYETNKTGELITRIGQPNYTPRTNDEKKLLNELKKQIGREVGRKVRAYQGRIQLNKVNQENIKNQAEKSLYEIKQSADNEIFKLKQQQKITIHDINNSVNKIVEEYSKKRTKLAIAGGTAVTIFSGSNIWKYFLRREIYSGIHGGY